MVFKGGFKIAYREWRSKEQLIKDKQTKYILNFFRMFRKRTEVFIYTVPENRAKELKKMNEQEIVLALGENTVLFKSEDGLKICSIVIFLEDDSIDMTMIDMYDLEKAKVGMSDGKKD